MVLRTLLQQGASCPFEGHQAGSVTVKLLRRVGWVETEEGVEVSFLTTLQHPVTVRFMDALNKAPLYLQ